jgi:tRNA pseudouridine55 synthase
MTEGIINLIKPPGMSSNDLVTDVKRLFSARFVGHLGTLDVGAAGVLPVALGRATKLFDNLVDKEKEYLAELTVGQETDTQDAFGRIIASAENHITESQIRDVLPLFLGRQTQIAPIYSALKHNGQKLYDLALKGEAIEKVRWINISEIDFIEMTRNNRALIRVVCSRGAYIRTLCRDIGRSLNLYAHMSFLLRTRSGMFSLDDAITFPQLCLAHKANVFEQHIVSCEQALSFFPKAVLPIGRLTAAKNGLPTSLNTVVLSQSVMSDCTEQNKSFCSLYCEKIFLGIGEVTENSVRLKIHLYAINA